MSRRAMPAALSRDEEQKNCRATVAAGSPAQVVTRVAADNPCRAGVRGKATLFSLVGGNP